MKKTLKIICIVLFVASLLILFYGEYKADRGYSGYDYYTFFSDKYYSQTIIPISFYILIGIYSVYKNDIRLLGYNGIYGFCLTFLWSENSTMALNALMIVMIAEAVLSLICGNIKSYDN